MDWIAIIALLLALPSVALGILDLIDRVEERHKRPNRQRNVVASGQLMENQLISKHYQAIEGDNQAEEVKPNRPDLSAIQQE